MSADTNIEWCHATANWWAGCNKVSPACDNCYAERMAGLLTNSIRMKLPASVRSDAIEAFDGVPNGSKAGQVRALLAQCGPLNAASICLVVDIESTSLVGPVMKWDMKLGRVLLEDGKYFLNPRFVEEEAAQVRAAVNLLRKHGYRVKEPS